MSALQPTTGDFVEANAIHTLLALSTFHLFQNPMTVNKGSVVGDFTEATFDGYAAETLTTVPAPIFDAVNGGVSILVDPGLFTFSGPGVPPVTNTIYGWYYLTAGGVLVACGNFDNPISMARVGDAIPVDVLLNWAA